jgi:hypothetical protein
MYGLGWAPYAPLRKAVTPTQDESTDGQKLGTFTPLKSQFNLKLKSRPEWIGLRRHYANRIADTADKKFVHGRRLVAWSESVIITNGTASITRLLGESYSSS